MWKRKIKMGLSAAMSVFIVLTAAATPAFADLDTHDGGGISKDGKKIDYFAWSDSTGSGIKSLYQAVTQKERPVKYTDGAVLIYQYINNERPNRWAEYSLDNIYFNVGTRNPFKGNTIYDHILSHDGLVERLNEHYAGNGGVRFVNRQYEAMTGGNGIDLINEQLEETPKEPEEKLTYDRDVIPVLVTVTQEGKTLFDRSYMSAEDLWEHASTSNVQFKYETKEKEFSISHKLTSTIQYIHREINYYWQPIFDRHYNKVIDWVLREEKFYYKVGSMTRRSNPTYVADVPEVEHVLFQPWNLNTMSPEGYGTIPLDATPYHNGEKSSETLKTTDTNISKEFSLQLNDQLGIPHESDGGIEIQDSMPEFRPEINRKSQYFSIKMYAGTSGDQTVNSITDLQTKRESNSGDLTYERDQFGLSPRKFGFKSIKANKIREHYSLGNHEGTNPTYWTNKYQGVIYYDYGGMYKGYVNGAAGASAGEFVYYTGTKHTSKFQGGFGKHTTTLPSEVYPGLARYIAKNERELDQAVLSGKFQVGSLGGDNE